MPDLTPAEREIAERCERATSGPWRSTSLHQYDQLRIRVVHTDDAGTWSLFELTSFEQNAADADFIAHARTDIPALLAALRHERQLRAELEAALQDLLNAIKST
jgi:hypothetical protein